MNFKQGNRILGGGLVAEPLWQVTSNWWRDDADEDVGVPKWDVIISDV
jgi:hypothetical protein